MTLSTRYARSTKLRNDQLIGLARTWSGPSLQETFNPDSHSLPAPHQRNVQFIHIFGEPFLWKNGLHSGRPTGSERQAQSIQLRNNKIIMIGK